MASVSDGLRLDIDLAKVDGQHLIGIKLDQSKCFDRIIPPITAALMLALGLPRGLVNMFTMMYQGLKKHLSYRNWIAHIPVTNANGVAQGCSLSLWPLTCTCTCGLASLTDFNTSPVVCLSTTHTCGFLLFTRICCSKPSAPLSCGASWSVNISIMAKVFCGGLRPLLGPSLNRPFLSCRCHLNLTCLGPKFTPLKEMRFCSILPNAVKSSQTLRTLPICLCHEKSRPICSEQKCSRRFPLPLKSPRSPSVCLNGFRMNLFLCIGATGLIGDPRCWFLPSCLSRTALNLCASGHIIAFEFSAMYSFSPGADSALPPYSCISLVLQT